MCLCSEEGFYVVDVECGMWNVDVLCGGRASGC